MLNSEPQTCVIFSETLQVFLLLSDLSKIPDVRTLLRSLKKASTEKNIFEKGKKGQQFFQGGARASLIPPPPPPVTPLV